MTSPDRRLEGIYGRWKHWDCAPRNRLVHVSHSSPHWGKPGEKCQGDRDGPGATGRSRRAAMYYAWPDRPHPHPPNQTLRMAAKLGFGISRTLRHHRGTHVIGRTVPNFPPPSPRFKSRQLSQIPIRFQPPPLNLGTAGASHRGEPGFHLRRRSG